MNEKEFEEIIYKYPELIENDLTVIDRQLNVGGKFVDLLFKDRHDDNLIVELKIGTIQRVDIGQLMDYYGYFLSQNNDVTVRAMIIRVVP